jgi:hypothetical protein
MDPMIFKDSVLAALLLVNMLYIGRKIDRLTEAVFRSMPLKRVKR